MLELYKELIIDHGLNPRNKYHMIKYTNKINAFNHFCGDSFILYLNIINNEIKDLSFEGQGCSISTASASIMTTILKKKTISEADSLFDYLKKIIHNNLELNEENAELNVLANVKKFPSRVKCATLIWNALKEIINENKGINNA